jgi:23S rRNA pseudouridine1911/1915/1917 synthase
MKYTLEGQQLKIETLGAYEGKTVEDFLNDYQQSKKNRYLCLQEHRILLDDVIVKDIHAPIHSSVITLINEESTPDWKPAAEPCQVVYEDAFLYIVHKEAGYIIHGDENDTACLNAQAARYQLLHHINAPVRPIHRLDRDTAGLVLYSKLPFFQPWFDWQLSEKKIRRNYLAACYGKAEVGQKFTCTQPIGRDRHVSNKYRISPTGLSAVTHVECIAVKNGFCFMKCELETGRTHQIRVHLAARGYPIVNDPLYGSPSHDFSHMGLWAYEVEIRNPITHKKHKIHDIPNEDFIEISPGEKK